MFNSSVKTDVVSHNHCLAAFQNLPFATQREQRLERVLRHIDEHLDEPLTLRGLSQRVHLSEYHFQRVFTAWLGMSPREYIQQSRLARAAQQLREQAGRNVLDIAIENGYQTQSGFSKAFRRQYGVSVSQWRAVCA